ncbi:LacI family transcriptional regulator [Pectobacterium phage POP12]|nr:LacI family transcriptional regulator [Pectobacterium phage POP12]
MKIDVLKHKRMLQHLEQMKKHVDRPQCGICWNLLSYWHYSEPEEREYANNFLNESFLSMGLHPKDPVGDYNIVKQIGLSRWDKKNPYSTTRYKLLEELIHRAKYQIAMCSHVVKEFNR